MIYGIVLRNGIMMISPGPRIPTYLPRYNKTTRSHWLTIFILSANSTRIIIRAMIIAIICKGSIRVLFLYTDDYSVQPKKGIGYGSRHERESEKIPFKKGFFAASPIDMDMETGTDLRDFNSHHRDCRRHIGTNYCAMAEKVCGNHQDTIGMISSLLR